MLILLWLYVRREDCIEEKSCRGYRDVARISDPLVRYICKLGNEVAALTDALKSQTLQNMVSSEAKNENDLLEKSTMIVRMVHPLV